MARAGRQDVTGLLARASAGDALATEEIFPLVYDELRRLAGQELEGERTGHTLQPTALVNEAYLRLVGPGEVAWQSRAHFFGAAARAIRRILVDHARARGRLKRGGGEGRRATMDEASLAAIPADGTDVVALDEALSQLAALDEEKARVVELRYFGGLSIEETSRAMGISTASVSRYWDFAKAWLLQKLTESES